MVVEVLMTSCQVSENPNSGPVRAQIITNVTQAMNAKGLPEASATAFANFVNSLLIRHGNAATCRWFQALRSCDDGCMSEDAPFPIPYRRAWMAAAAAFLVHNVEETALDLPGWSLAHPVLPWFG